MKQKFAFVVGSLPIFNTLKEISIATALNPKAQIPINLPLYFGISMPAFVTLHIVEHTLPIGMPRNMVKFTKVLAGIPFCVMSEVVDKTSSQVLKALKMPDTTLDMQGTIGVPSDIRLEEILKNMQGWREDKAENLESLKELYELQRKKKNEF